MKYAVLLAAMLLCGPLAAKAADGAGANAATSESPGASETHTKPQLSISSGTVTIGGQRLGYKANAGTLILTNDKRQPTASMFYVAYFKDGVNNPDTRPLTFFFNGGPGSATVWLHMGAFGPRRVRTDDTAHTPAAPYQLVDNEYSLLDATDMVFVDAPGTGFSRVLDKSLGGQGDPKDFYGVDSDGVAFTSFIEQFLSQYGRWNSPKYLLGESYGAMRAPVVALDLQNASVDLNGLIMLSMIDNIEMGPGFDGFNPAIDVPYALVLPTMAAIAWYHDKLTNKPPQLEPFLKEVEHFAMTDYLSALNAGSDLDDASRQRIAGKLHGYIGLPVAYLLKANLRVTGWQFEHELLRDSGDLAGRQDGRFAGPALDPLGENAEYDPSDVAVDSAYVSSFNDYARKELKVENDLSYIPLSLEVNGKWDFKHVEPGVGAPLPLATNVLPDLAAAMTQNPDMKVMLNGGYYDLSTTFYSAEFQLHHLPMNPSLQQNISYAWYPSGHMIYANEASLKALHDNVARFIESTHGSGG